MKLLTTLILFVICFFSSNVQAQSQNKSPKPMMHNDSLYLAKMNSRANLMIGGGVGLCAAGGYLVYQGISVYRTRDHSGTASSDAQNDQNKKQGIAYLAGAGVGIAAGIVLIALGARTKVDFKRRKNEMSLNWGILPNGQIGLALAL